MEYCSAINKNELLPLTASWIDLEGILYDIAYMWNLKKYKKLVNITQKKQTTVIQNKLVVTRGRRRSLVGCSPWGCTESDTTERLHFHFSLSCIGEGNAPHSSVLAWRIPGTGSLVGC